jgi:hypothetical protein
MMIYFADYQVALVLRGIGAAFRLSNHLMTGTAVILQDFVYQEWYTKYLVPYVHYIPLSEDLHDLNETLHWVQDHPVEVKAIAGQGRLFWEKYLTFQNHEEHIFELVYRLSEYTHYLSTNITTHLIPAIEPVKLPETEELVSDVAAVQLWFLEILMVH